MAGARGRVIKREIHLNVYLKISILFVSDFLSPEREMSSRPNRTRV